MRRRQKKRVEGRDERKMEGGKDIIKYGMKEGRTLQSFVFVIVFIYL